MSAVENVFDDVVLPEFDGHFADAVTFGLDVIPCHDIDGDDVVGTSDLLILLAQWGPCPPKCFGDISGDGVVGTIDLLELLANWGPCE